MTEPPPANDPAKDDEPVRRNYLRAEREAEALRENLRRRKQQARARNTPESQKPKPD